MTKGSINNRHTSIPINGIRYDMELDLPKDLRIFQAKDGSEKEIPYGKFQTFLVDNGVAPERVMDAAVSQKTGIALSKFTWKWLDRHISYWRGLPMKRKEFQLAMINLNYSPTVSDDVPEGKVYLRVVI